MHDESLPLLAPRADETGASRRRLRLAALSASAAVIAAACGGGGGGAAAPAPAPTPAPSPPPTTTACAAPSPTPALAAATAIAAPPAFSGAFAITGVATFDSVPTNSTGRGLNYAGTTQQPIRGATVQLLDASDNVLGTTFTTDTGVYAFAVNTAQAMRVRVRAEIRRSGTTNDRDFTVRDNTASGALYVLDSAAFTPSASTTAVNLRAASGWGGTSYTGTRAAAPFAILDVAYAAQAKIATTTSVALPPLQIYWSVNNQPTSPFNATTGSIGTSFFTGNSTSRSLFILGAADTDTDEYDGHVIAHELGHYVQSAVSRDDSPGGPHSTGDRLDPRLAFSEGWGNAWSGMALGSPVYTDSSGAGQQAGFSFSVATAATGTNRGAYSETSSQYLLWSLHQDPAVGFTPIYRSLRGLASSPSFTMLYSFADQLKAAATSAATAVTTLFASQQIVAQDACGTGETNNGGDASTLPVYKDYGATVGITQNYCVTTAADPDSEGNKLGRYVYLRFALSGARTITATRAGGSFTGASDPDLILVKSDGSRVLANADTSSTQTLNTTLPAGTHVLGIEDFNLTSPSTSCFNVTVN